METFTSTVWLYVGLGAFAGTMAGLLGVGGGLIIVPILAWIFHAQQIPEAVIMHLAIGTSLATIMVTSLSSVSAHHRHGAVLWPPFWQLTPGIVVGTWIGAVIADQLSSVALTKIFGVFVLIVAAQMAFGAKPPPQRHLPNTCGMGVVGIIIGAVSSIVGIGGGSLTVPFLVWCNVSIRQAVGTSAACGFPIAVAGALGFMFTGWDAPGLPSGSLGYVYGPALAGVTIASMCFAPLGAQWAHTLPTNVLKRIFAGMLLVIGVRMLLY